MDKRKNIIVSEATKQLRREAMLGRKHDEATKEKMRAAALNRKPTEATRAKWIGREFSKEHLAKLGLSVTVENIHTGEIVEYTSMTEAANALGVTQPLIKKYLSTGKVLKKSYYITSDPARVEKLAIRSAIKRLSVLVKNTETGEITEYASMAEAGRALGVSSHKVKSHLKGGELITNIFSIIAKVA